ncbi:MAG TPA: lytic transglycosylase domain-containing protein [Dokdonella sp.]|uniref:lytic transglycosylase domain-containing protein n=1 Tax=Dokdonella sp. TaxID=2291710 RepID=UPI002BF79BA6|nr:lytic transglycosylase domain-containing protein [Dokdonella sp.]HUD40609.1 lytic transglycosylase domain-containing protein [Dokdonella sp.]
MTSRPLLALLLPLALALLPGAAARADTVYKCEGPDGTIAYGNVTAGFRNCKVFATASAAASKPAAAGSMAATSKWTYEQSSRPDVKATAAGVTSTAPAAGPAADAPPAAPPRRSTAKVTSGAVYRVDRGDGITEYTNIKPRGGRYATMFTYIATCIACDVHSTIDWLSTRLKTDLYREEIAAAAAESGVDAALIRAVIHAESAFNPLALSHKGAQGLMQLMPGTAGDLGVIDAFDIGENIRGGARYLAQMLKHFNGDERLATAAYNAGPAAVQKHGGIPPYAETKLYVERVATLRERYGKAN